MTLHQDLLEHARNLADSATEEPSQATLRRSISAAYYALFHLLIDESTSYFLSGRPRDGLRRNLARCFEHGHMRNAANLFARGERSRGGWLASLPSAPSASLVRVANSFVLLQELRHAADYDVGRNFTRAETIGLVGRAESAFAEWSLVSGSDEAAVFLTALLVRGRS